MAVPNIIVTLSGTSYPIPQVGSTPWGQNVTNWIVAASGANGFIQVGGGSQPLLADLNLGANFGLISIYYKSRSANIAAAGMLRLANIDNIDWRNFGNTADCILTPGHTASSQSVDDLYYQNGTTGVFTQLTGNPLASYATNVAIPWTTSVVIANFNTSAIDTDSAVTTGASWKFTVPANKGGQYFVSGFLVFLTLAGASSCQIGVQKNGAVQNNFNYNFPAGAGATQSCPFSTVFVCAPGDTINVVVSASAASAGAAFNNTIVIKRIS